MAESVYPLAMPPTYEVPANLLRRTGTAAQQPTAFLADYAWDAETGDLEVDGGGNVVIADGRTAAEQWVEKVSVTQQHTYPIYPRGFGPDLEHAIGRPNASHKRADVEARLRTELRRALVPSVGDPRVRTVDDFTFTWSLDQLDVAYRVTFADGSRARLTSEVPV